MFNDMTEIVLDAPNAYHTLSKFVERCRTAGFLTHHIAEQLPQRWVSVVSRHTGRLRQVLDKLLICDVYSFLSF